MQIVMVQELHTIEVRMMVLAYLLFLHGPERPLRMRTNQWDIILNQPEAEWKEQFRLSWAAFAAVRNSLLKLTVFKVPVNIGDRAVDVSKQLAMYLMRFGQEKKTVGQIAHYFDASKLTVINATMRVAHAICKAFPYSIYLESSGERKDEEMRGFAEKRFPGCRGIIDVTSICIVPPSEAVRGGYAEVYMNRHDDYVKAYQVLCDANMRILHIFGGYGGRTSDQTILNQSALMSNVGTLLKEGEWFACDMGYALKKAFISGFRKPEITGTPNVPVTSDKAVARTRFNRFFSGMRITIERTFGMLKARFRSLLSGLFLRDSSEYSTVIKSLCILHNICIEYKDSWDPQEINELMKLEQERKAARQMAIQTAEAAAPAVHPSSLEAGRAHRQLIAGRLGLTV